MARSKQSSLAPLLFAVLLAAFVALSLLDASLFVTAQHTSVKTATKNVDYNSHAAHDHSHGHGHSHGGHSHGHEEEHGHDRRDEHRGHLHSHGGHDHAHSHGHNGHHGDGPWAKLVGSKNAPTYALSALLILPYLSSSLLYPILSALPTAFTNAALCFAGGSVIAEVWVHGVGDRLAHSHGHGEGGHEEWGFPESVLLGIAIFFGLGKVLNVIVSGSVGGSHGHVEHGEKEHDPGEKVDKKDEPVSAEGLRKRAARVAGSHDHDHDHDHDEKPSSAQDHSQTDHSHSHSHSPAASSTPSASLLLHLISLSSHSALEALALSLAFHTPGGPVPWSALSAVLIHELPHRLSALLISAKLGGSGAQTARWAAVGTMLGWAAGYLAAHLGQNIGGDLLPGISAGALLYVGMVEVLGEFAGHGHSHGDDDGHGHGGKQSMMGAMGEVVALGVGMWSSKWVAHEH